MSDKITYYHWFEVLDRISVIQDNIETHIRNHSVDDEHLKELVDKAQECLAEAYQYAGTKLDDLFESLKEK